MEGQDKDVEVQSTSSPPQNPKIQSPLASIFMIFCSFFATTIPAKNKKRKGIPDEIFSSDGKWKITGYMLVYIICISPIGNLMVTTVLMPKIPWRFHVGILASFWF